MNSSNFSNRVNALINFVAIDFETANASRDSACALGAAIVRDGQIVDRRYTLLRPDVPFQRFCTYIHGIHESDVVHSPRFDDIYPTLFALLNEQTVAAHNASFDIAVLQASCRSRGLHMPQIESFCSVEMARKAWPELPKHKLNALCAAFSLPLKHHNAVEDATACAAIILRCAQELGVDSLDALRIILQRNAQRAAKRKLAEAAEQAQIAVNQQAAK